MNAKILEKYFKTENEHWNDFAFQLLCDVLKLENFEHPEVALKMYSKGIDIVMEQHQTPLQAVTNIEKLLDKASLKASQKLYIINKIYNYLIKTEFDDVYPYKVEQLLESYQKRLYREVHDVKVDLDEKKVLVADIRTSLKEVMEKEMAQLSDTLNKLDAQQRVTTICKLIPYVLPKVHTIHSEKGEGGVWD